MPIDLKSLSGIMNLDAPNAEMPPFHHKFLMNGRFRFGRAESIPGTVFIPNYLLPAGNNECIGAFYDPVKRRIIWFNYNSNGRNGIYQYSIATGSISKIFLCFTDSADDILHFSLDLPVNSASIVYRTESDGDLLYFTDGQFGDGNLPRGFNIDTVSALVPFTEDMINACKNAPLSPPSVSYQNDATKTVNNIRKLLFEICYRWTYKNLDKSTLSPISKLALPVNGYNVDTQNDPTLNNNILIGFKTGPTDFQSVEILGRSSQGQEYGDFFSIITLNQDDYNYNPDTTYTYPFYNDGNYVTADLTDADKTFSYLPDKANALEVLRGNVLMYSGTTDGKAVVSRSATNVIVGSGSGAAGIPSFTFVYSGTHEITALVGATVVAGTTYHIQFNYSSGAGGDASPKNVNYVAILGDNQDSIASALSGLVNGNNITADLLGSGYIRIFTSTGMGSITSVVTTVSTAGTAAANAAWKPSCQERLGLIYFDDRGKTNGVVYFPQNSIDTNVFDTNTPIFTVSSNVIQVPYLTGSINSTPPTWAKTYQWIRVPMTPKFLEWITNDYQTDSDFLYFCIQNLTYTQTKTSGYVPAYDFAKGDRIKVLASFDSGTGFLTPYNLQLDMEILGVENRNMTSPVTSGRFIKVAKPTTFPSQPYVSNMLIELYTPYVRNLATDQIFYEWGEKYDIYELATVVLNYTLFFGTLNVGDNIIEAVTNATGVITSISATQIEVTNVVGTFQGGLTFTDLTSGAAGSISAVADGDPIRFHRGQLTDQTLAQPATFQWFDGDIYFKERQFYLNVGDTSTVSVFMFDVNYSDYFPSQVNSNGRGWEIDPNAGVIYNSVQSRWGGKYQQDTNINQLNIFQPVDFDVADLSGGDICRLLTEESLVYVYQKHKVGAYGIYARYIQNNDGNSQLVTTDDIITANNINYLEGNYGLGNQPSALWRGSNGRHYFADDTRGDILRRSGDGIDNLSEIYNGQYTLRSLITPYNKPYTRTNGSKSKIIGFYDFFEGNAHFILQEGSYNGIIIPNNNFSFCEKQITDTEKGFLGFYQFYPEWALQAEDVTFSWKNGQLYRHTNEDKWCNFYGTQYYPSITLVFNLNNEVNKLFNSVGYESEGKIWQNSILNSFNGGENIDAIVTSFVNPQTNFRQSSRLKNFNYEIFQGKTIAAFLRDINSRQFGLDGLYEGDYLQGFWIEVKFEYTGSDFSFFRKPYVNFELNNRNF